MFRIQPIRAAVVLLTGLLAGAVVTPAAEARLPLNTAFATVANNPAELLVNLPLDPLGYDPATRCVKQPTKGALALVAWLPTVSHRGSNWGIIRCELWGKGQASLHAEGRAVDWHVDAAVPAERAEAESLIALLLAADSRGQPAALARRLGIQGLIWDCRAWWGRGTGLVRYGICTNPDGSWKRKVDPTLAHRNHIHLELSKAGAALRTSWWTAGPGQGAAARVRGR